MADVHRLSPKDERAAEQWDAFVRACPDATFFHWSRWQQVLRKALRHETHYLFYESSGRIEGVLPLAHVRSLLFGSSLVGLPFAVYGGVAATSDAAADALEKAAQQLAERLRVGHLELRNVHSRHVEWPRQDLYVTFRKALLPDVEANMLAIPRKQRAMVRKGIKNGLRSEVDDKLDRFYSLYASNVHRHGTPALPRGYFQMLLAEFKEDAQVMTVVSADGKPLSSVLSFYFRDEVLPYYAGDDPLARDTAANDFKYWQLMRYACERGIKVFDYGRSKRGTGSYAFKKNWGFESTPLHYEYCLYKRDAVPQNNPASSRFRLLIEAWRRMPAWMATRLGPFVVRNLG